MKYPTAPLLEHVAYLLMQPVALVLWLWYKRHARSINDWYAHVWQWNNDDCNVFFIAARKEDVDAAHEEELEDAYNLYVDMCRSFGIVPKDFIDVD